MATVEICAVEKAYGATPVVRGVSLRVEAGSMLALLGPSGCGKTTTLRLVAGLERPDAGTIRIGDQVVNDGALSVAPDKRGLGMVFQSYAVWPHRTVEENVAYPLVLQKRSRSEIATRVAEALSWVRLTGLGTRSPHQLSGGQLQRVALARALVANPRVLLLDEPLSNLDVSLREQLRGEIAALRARLGTTTILVTHDQSEALALADSVAVMQGGRIEQWAAPEVVYERPSTAFVAQFVGGAALLEGAAEAGHFVWGELRFALPAELRGATGLGTLAVCPEDLAVSLEGAGPKLPLAARLFAGQQVEYRFWVKDTVLRSLGPPLASVTAGTVLTLRLKRAHFFASGHASKSARV
jgi:iron(III) transport system ATP-binding protein